MQHAFICDGTRTPIGRYGGGLSSVRTDDLAAIPLRALMDRYPNADWAAVDDLFYGCANQAGEDNRNVGRMAALLAGLPQEVPGVTVNRLCGSGLDATAQASRSIVSGQADFVIAGGVESMSRAPMVMPKATAAFSRNAEIYDTTIGWRFINKALNKAYGTEAMPETAENLAEEFGISREDQDAFAYRSQMKAAAAMASGRLAKEITPVHVPQRKNDDLVISADEHPRASTTLEGLANLRAPFRDGGSVTAGNASGTNDGAAALLIASEEAAAKHGLTPRARIVGTAVAGVPPRIMGIGPVPATQKLLARNGLTLGDIDVIELNEAFAVQSLACMRQLGMPDDAEHVNINGGAIALGHPLGMSGARLALTLTEELHQKGARYGLATMCIGVGQGIAMLLERV
ncbi:MAG: 3-oxoadipyl-CoA thiolase [Kordiimonadales bacterium]|nr:MAG: 3-oxoadipyl-CoA thiolase [Kordiimonadales bacterium]